MKHAYLLFLCFVCYTASAQIPVEWAAPLGSENNDYVYDMTIDQEGNVYTTGFFNGTMDIDPGTAVENISSGGSQSMFVQKLNNLGELQWYYNIASGTVTNGYGIEVDQSGNVYVVGYFQSAADFDTGPGTAFLVGLSTSGGFLLKLNAQGQFAWVKGLLGSSDSDANEIAYDGASGLYVSGYYAGSMDANPGTAVNTLTSTGGLDCYIVKFNTAGNYLWSGSIGADEYQIINSMEVDNNGDLIMAGDFVGTGDFDPTSNSSNLSSSLTTDIFVVKVTSAGDFVFAQSFGGTGNEEQFDLAIDENNMLLITGRYEGTVDFDNSPNTGSLTSIGSTDTFIIKLNPDGGFTWVNNLGSTSTEANSTICTDEMNNFYVALGINLAVDFDFDAVGTQILSGTSGSADVAIAKYTENGVLIWATKCGGSDHETPKFIRAFQDDIIYACGYFTGTGVLSDDPSENNFVSAGEEDLYTLRMSCNTYGSETVTACDAYYWPITNMTYTTDGVYTGITTNSASCDSIVTLNLTINTVNNQVTQTGTTLTAVQNGATYQWIDCELKGTAIDGATNQSYTATENGSYAVQITLNNCSVNSVCFTYTDIGIREVANQAVLLMPNPAKENITLTANQVIKTITLYDVSGKLVDSFQSNKSLASLPITTLPHGTYILRITLNDDTTINKSFIKE
jgi:hypothetical protein